MEINSILVYLHDHSFDGFLTAVFEAYARKEKPAQIAPKDNFQQSLGQRLIYIKTDQNKSLRVQNGIRKKMGTFAYDKICNTFLSCEPDIHTVIYQYICMGMVIGSKLDLDLTNNIVLKIEKANGYVKREAHRIKEFLRFSKMEGNVFYAKIEPKNNVVPLVMPHFIDRYSIQPFLIHDPVHEIVGIYNLKEWFMLETNELQLPKLSPEEKAYRSMWKSFYDTIAVKERYNPKCRQNFMPKYFWKNLTEMTHLDVESPGAPSLSPHQLDKIQ